MNLDKRLSLLGHHHELGEVPRDCLHGIKWASRAGNRMRQDKGPAVTYRLPAAWLYRGCDAELHSADKRAGYKWVSWAGFQLFPAGIGEPGWAGSGAECCARKTESSWHLHRRHTPSSLSPNIHTNTGHRMVLILMAGTLSTSSTILASSKMSCWINGQKDSQPWLQKDPSRSGISDRTDLLTPFWGKQNKVDASYGQEHC